MTILSLSMTVLTLMVVTIKDHSSGIFISIVRAFLIAPVSDIWVGQCWILHPMRIELSRFQDDPCDRKDTFDIFNFFHMTVDFALHRWTKPVFSPQIPSIIESWFSITGLTVSPTSAFCSSFGHFTRDIITDSDFRKINNLILLSSYRSCKLTASGINSKFQILLIFCCFI